MEGNEIGLVLAAFRLPVTISARGSKLEFKAAIGGVATGLDAFYREHDAIWVGYPGAVPTGQQAEVRRRLRSEFNAVPVFLPERLVKKYYAGFANRALWPLFHCFPAYARYAAEEWEAYAKVNALFSERIAEVAGKSDPIWIHDYQLMLLPRYLRDRIPKAKIAFFLHIPFPPYDVLRLLPWHLEIVEGLLASDLIGLHTYDYAQALLSCVRRLKGYDNVLGQITAGRRVIQVDVFPMGIDFQKFAGARTTAAQRRGIGRIREQIGTTKLVLSISRLDYTKGIPEQLRTIRAFLERRPAWRGKVTWLLVVVPSRERVDRYAQLKREIDELVGQVNSRFATLDWIPVRYIYRSLRPEELAALYVCADIALITPLRDGMNLIAKEYLATKTDGQGVLILSEMAGAAKELLEALIVNPNSVDEVVAALEAALTMPEEEKIRRTQAMRAHLERHDVRQWAERFLKRFAEASALSEALSVRLLTPRDHASVRSAYARATRRLLLLDYDGTLAPFADDPERAQPSEKVRQLLEQLSGSPRNELYLLSGRRREDLEKWFGPVRFSLVAEHGAWVRWRSTQRWEELVPVSQEWKGQIRAILELFVERIPGSFIEEKGSSLVWHYRRTPAEAGFEAARELIDTLTNLTANMELQILLGNKVVEVKSTRAGKGVFYTTHLPQEAWEFVLAIGDDWTDETLFSVLPKEAYSIRVGYAASAARFNLESTDDVVRFLETLHRHTEP